MTTHRNGARGPLRRPWRATGGFTLIEMIVVSALVGLLLAVALPNIRARPHQHVRWAADRLIQDLELARTRALGSRRQARVVFDTTGHSYTGYLDDNRDGEFDEDTEEILALRGSGEVFLEREVTFGRGNVDAFPGDATSDLSVTFDSAIVRFDGRGVTTPFGSRGTIYLRHSRDPDAVAAVTITPAAAVEAWLWRDSTWVR